MLRPYASNFERIWYWSHRSICGLVLLFLMLPVLIMIPLSFNGGAFLVYPLQGWSLRWYETFFTSPEWMRALGNSMIVSPAATLPGRPCWHRSPERSPNRPETNHEQEHAYHPLRVRFVDSGRAGHDVHAAP